MKSELDAKEKDRLSAQSEVDGHRRRQEKHDQHIKELQREVHDKQEKLRRRDTKIAELEKSIQALRLEINVRNDTISASEKKILELKKQTAELEKLRYVLTFKFNELRKEVAPKEDTIKAMTGRIDVMDSDLERTGHDREALRQLLVERNEKIRITLHDVHRLNKQLEDKKRVHELLLKELNALLSKTEPKKLIFGLRETIDKYSPKSMKETAKEEEKMVEFERQRFYMEAQLSALKKQNIRRDERVGIDTQRKTEENAILVREVNDLRHQKKLLTQRVLVSDSQLKDVRQASARVSLTPIDNAGEVRAPPRDGRPQQQRPLKPLHDAAVVHSPTPGGPLGKLHRGTTRSLRDLAQLDPVKIAEIIQTVERNGVDMAKQQAEIQRLRDFVQHLLKRLQDTEGMDSADPPVVDAVSPDPAAQADLVIPTALLSNATLLS
ncbi:hypothetical protein DIPPA_28679 [Diplonema papillatum]|nr:hypothetical protein DIPPA_28679 [Diplonema papillatum]